MTVSINIQATNTKINVAEMMNSEFYSDNSVLYITENEKGSIRGLFADKGMFGINDSFTAILGKRNADIGILKIVAIVEAGIIREFDSVPTNKIPLRIMA